MNENSIARTLFARYYKVGSEILVSQGPRKRLRRLTPRERARLMGLPDSFKIPVSDTQACQLLAEAAVVPMIDAVAKCMVSKPVTKEAPMIDTASISPTAFLSDGNWTSEQLKLAFNFYCQTPFGKLHSKNPQIVELAAKIPSCMRCSGQATESRSKCLNASRPIQHSSQSIDSSCLGNKAGGMLLLHGAGYDFEEVMIRGCCDAEMYFVAEQVGIPALRRATSEEIASLPLWGGLRDLTRRFLRTYGQ